MTDANLSQIGLPRISVIIPIHNGESDLPDLLHCLAQQSYPAALAEYLLVDNNSSDQTLKLLRTLPAANMRCLREMQIQSAYAARNTGIRAAQGEILVFTDADCRPQPNWLLHLVQPFTAPEVGLVAGEVLALPGNTLLERYADRQATLSQKHTLAHRYLPYGQTANLAVRRQVFEQVGLFRPYLTTGGDADLCWRALQFNWKTDCEKPDCEKLGWAIRLAEQAVVQHRHRPTLAELRSQWQRYGRSNQYLHDLHGVDLARPLSRADRLHRWSRWLLKELPLASMLVFMKSPKRAGASHWIDAMVETPLSLICQQARAQGQRQAQLPEAAREIVWLDSVPDSAPDPVNYRSTSGQSVSSQQPVS
ncbi:MAG: glycosyltransferase [Pegethrix bostrychoides GSE-TBD4-15B]|jgi:glycosyltransferase involved in cell wall biosynthesis|uniref:Glycosyltransferase n=1 Tax=Pegethrix bostrychoides GSE-TBD4-15B TaxID=2839662 RepID=A0A951U5S0_9CYAN|nr:glycosyltransferase [Pegethrix bostrychoides GSE-TBD4-15B]